VANSKKTKPGASMELPAIDSRPDDLSTLSTSPDQENLSGSIDTLYLITVGTNASIMPITSEARNAPKIDTLIPGTRY
jgi:hypothetical protein